MFAMAARLPIGTSTLAPEVASVVAMPRVVEAKQVP
jgi:hypothetical protein